jgi:uncharacterized delta-60 repeat protein
MGIGSLDTTFSADGKLVEETISGDDIAVSTVIQGDGKLVVLGIKDQGTNQKEFYLRRYNRDGSADLSAYSNGSSFNDNVVNTTRPQLLSNVRDAVKVIQKGDFFYVTGRIASGVDFPPDIFVAKYRLDGTLETTFGSQQSGFAYVGNLSDDEVPQDMVIQSDGKIVIVGYVFDEANQKKDILVIRLNSNGTLDSTFGSNGKVIEDVGDDDSAFGVRLQQFGAEQRIVVTGSTGFTAGGGKDIVVLRYSANGSLDQTFNGNGKQKTDLSSGNDIGRDLEILANGQILVVGETEAGPSGISDFAIVRYDINGQFVAKLAFNASSKATGKDGAVRALKDATGKIVVLGNAEGIYLDQANKEQLNQDTALIRLNIDGTIDSTFGVNSVIRTPIGSSSAFDAAMGLAVQSDRIVITGRTAPARLDSGDSFIASYKTISVAANDANSDGKPDITWKNYSTGTIEHWSFNTSSWTTATPTFDTVAISQEAEYANSNWKIEATGDFDGDGDLDLVYRNYGSNAQKFGGNIIALANGTQYTYENIKSNNTTVDLPDATWKIETAGDFDGDGKDDLVWRSYGGSSFGENYVWLMNGNQVKADGFKKLAGTVADSAWHIEAAADLNSDGKCDLVWRNYGSSKSALGQNLIWFMNGTSLAQQNPYQSLLSVRDANWTIEAARDVNADGFADLLWRNRNTGENASWLMTGSGQVQDYKSFSGRLTSEWRIDASGDFDGNGTTDLFWRNYGSDPSAAGQNVIWLKKNTASYSPTDYDYAVLSPLADANWHVETAGDFDRDGKADLVWRNYGTGDSVGQNVIWLMNGGTIKGYAGLTTVEDTNWRIEGSGDFNQDGRTDLVWRNYGSGSVIGAGTVWTMNGQNGNTINSFQPLGNILDINSKIAGVGDYDNDGDIDIFYRNQGTDRNIIGSVTVALNSGGAYQYIYIGRQDNLDWEIETICDLNKDGRSDIVWRNYGSNPVENGKTIAWLNSSNGITSANIGNPVIIGNLLVTSTWDFS